MSKALQSLYIKILYGHMQRWYVSSYGELIYEYVTDRYSNAYVNSTRRKRCECKEKSALEKYEIETIYLKAYLWYVKIIEFKFPL